MLLKTLALGTLAYVGYRFVQSSKETSGGKTVAPSDLRLAGGPLSDQAAVQSTDKLPPL